jgi:hypothetical protein
MIKLNLGCGPDIKLGYTNIDTCPLNSNVVVQDIRNLQFDKASVDEIYAKDIIEHMTLDDFIRSIANWSFISKKDALLFIQTTCIDLMIEAYSTGVWDITTLNYMLFAGKNWVNGVSTNEDLHKSCYSRLFLETVLSQNQFKILNISLNSIDDMLRHNPYSHNLNIMIQAQKQ